MKVTVLADNLDRASLRGEWGLSMYIQYEGPQADAQSESTQSETGAGGDTNVLLDTGLSPLFAQNADSLGLDLEAVDVAVLSHAHDDHANGMDTFFERNSHAKFYVAHGCGENCYDRHGLFFKYAGIPRGIMKRHADRIVVAEPDQYIAPGVRLLGHTTPDLDKLGLADKMYLREGFLRFIPDDFRHEQSLVFELPEGIVIFNSCSHAGADNIVREVSEVYPDRRIIAMIGGFHLFNKTDDYVRAFTRRLVAAGAAQIWTGHCTGARALEIMKEEAGSMVNTIYTGLSFEL